uniref:KRAB domain-containing protein n=1 Tax=Podarcis muralis TaxID=64176 RepID=A0A670JAL7_PODMU
QNSLCFEDVAVHFTDDEWALLHPDQRALHEEVMGENREIMDSLGKTPCCITISVLKIIHTSIAPTASGTAHLECTVIYCLVCKSYSPYAFLNNNQVAVPHKASFPGL